ncbi:MAG: membrane protein insertase YidC [Anaerolineae bacterium]|nr:membrane protein insertase YidC [Anaerolineae bacterium]
MRDQISKTLTLVLVVVAGYFLFNSFSSYFTAKEATPEATTEAVATPTPSPYVPPETAVVATDQKSGVTLKKIVGSNSVPLGQVVSYTVIIKNEQAETINATLTDALSEGLVLQNIVSATIGTAKIDLEANTLFWSGSLAQNDEAQIHYGAIPPSTSTPGQTFSNVARLQFGDTTLEASTPVTTQKPELGIWGRFVNLLALTLVWLDSILGSVGLPYSFGFAIILFTVAVRGITFPLNMQQIKSSKAMQELQPKLKELQAKYKDDKEKLAQEQMALYKEHGVNPLGGCLPMLVQMPIWFALYQSLRQLSREGLLNEGFFWIPSLSGPVSDWGGGLGWLWPLPPSIGWAAALAYLVLPVLLVVSQLYMQQMMTPPSTDPQQQSIQSVMKFMPFMFGYFALVVPSGLTLYWFVSNLLAIAQQYFTKTQLQTAPATAGASTQSAKSAGAAGSISTNPAPADEPASANPGGSTKSARKSKRKKRRNR